MKNRAIGSKRAAAPASGSTVTTGAEGDTHVSGDSGIAVWAVRSDIPEALTDDGTYHPVETDAEGRLHTKIGVGDPVQTVLLRSILIETRLQTEILLAAFGLSDSAERLRSQIAAD